MTGELLIVSPATTAGWRTVEQELAGSLERLEVPYRVNRLRLGPSRRLRRAWPLVDLVEAAAARRALREGLAEAEPAAVILLTSTAALLAPVARLRRRGIPVAIRLDCPAAVNRPGVANLVQRGLEKRRLGEATLVVAMGPRSAETVAGLASVVVPLPVAIEVPPGPAVEGPPRILCYVPDASKKGLDVIVQAWAGLGSERGNAVLSVAGQDAASGPRFLAERGIVPPAAIEWVGVTPRDAYLDLVRAARAYVSASRREDHGVAQLEVLAAGVPLVTTPSTGAYEAEPLARELAPSLVASGHDPVALSGALRAALSMTAEERHSYRQRAERLLEPFGRPACDAIVRERVLPALLG